MAEEQYDVVVVGGGSAGLMAAGRAAELGKRVLLLEKNKRLGEKLRISGGGRCNIANAEPDLRALLGAYGKAEQFLYSSFSQFGTKDTFTFFENRDLPLVVQARNRVFPKTEKAADVVKTLEAYVRDAGVEVVSNSPVTALEHDGSKIVSVRCGTKTYSGDTYILATGSVSHPETGSTGDGFGWLKQLGHTVVAPTPTIVPLKVKESWSKLLAGITVPQIKITFFVDGKKAFSKTGGILFTHFGLSGPLILNSAGAVSDLLQAGEVGAIIDLYPQSDLGTLERQVVEAFDANKNKVFKNVLKEFLPNGTARGILALLDGKIDPETKVHSITKEDRKVLVRLLKSLPLTIDSLMGFDRAVIADGGVPLGEVDTRTMQSKKISNLYLVGDLLHINRPSGGYSLQLCWSTGYVAGTHAAQSKQ